MVIVVETYASLKVQDNMTMLDPEADVLAPAKQIEEQTKAVTVLELTKGAIRDEPVRNQILKGLEKAAIQTGGISRIEITSGGQLSRNSVLKRSGGKSSTFLNGKAERTNSSTTNHDHGNAADFLVYDKNNKVIRMDEPRNERLLTNFVKNLKGNGFTNFGAGAGYMGGAKMHAGVGNNHAVWGAGGRGENAPQWLRQAFYSTKLNKFQSVSDEDRDILIRTVIGEGAGEDAKGQAAIAHVIFNRLNSGKFGNTVSKVALQPAQFSAWNAITGGAGGRGGNELVRKHGTDSPLYKAVGTVVDGVINGKSLDPTGGATHYFSPKGMSNNQPPIWWNEERAKGGGSITIGNHVFAGDPTKANISPASIEVQRGKEYTIDYDKVNRGTVNPFDLKQREEEIQVEKMKDAENRRYNTNVLNETSENTNMIQAYLSAIQEQQFLQQNKSIIEQSFEAIQQQTQQGLEQADQF